MLFRLCISTLSIVLVSLTSHAQLFEPKEKAAKHDSIYVIDYSEKLSIKLLGVIKSNEIIHYDNFTETAFKYKPNESFNLGFGVNYKWLGLDLAFNIPSFNNDDEVFGKTKSLDLQSNIYMTKLVFDVLYQNYKGYYGSNPEDYDPNFDDDNPVYNTRQDIRTKNYTIGGFYLFNHDRFSYRAAFTFNERQVKSAGTLLLGAYFNHFEMRADSSLIPLSHQEEANPDADFNGTKNINFGSSIGYAYNLVLFKRLFASASLAMGFGPQIQYHQANDQREAFTETKIASSLALRLALGYNGENFFMGISVFNNTHGNGDDEEAYLARGVNNVKIHIGRRFNIPKK